MHITSPIFITFVHQQLRKRDMTTKQTTPSLPFALPLTPTRGPCGTPRKCNTPSRTGSSTRRNSSASPGTCRYIPNRQASDLEFSKFQVAAPRENSPLRDAGLSGNLPNRSGNAGDGDFARSDMMNKLLALKGKKHDSRILTFQPTSSQNKTQICECEIGL